MPQVDDILVGNLRDAIGRAEQYVMSGIVSGALFLLLTTQAPTLLKTSQSVAVPTFGNVAPGFAAVILFCGYCVFGILANSVMRHIKTIASAISDARATSATMTQFSLLTIDNVVVRVGAFLLAPLLVLVGYLVEQQRGATHLSALSLVGAVLICAPYLPLAYRMRKRLETSRAD